MTAQRILIMGLPGAGKTYMGQALKQHLESHSVLFHPSAETVHSSQARVEWFNADDVRKRLMTGTSARKVVSGRATGCVS